MNLVPLFEEALEFQDYNGTVLSDGKVAVYYIGRTRLADIYEDVAGEYPAENPRILNNLGMGPIYVNPAFDYEMVVFDAYGSELFSVKKYLASKGEHSTANVVVTPSESIAVSAWTVGDVQVYMPYLTGQLGKVYTGIEPIVVNNIEDKISAQHVPLGVQDPLYFVQDDEEGCIIGADVSAFGGNSTLTLRTNGIKDGTYDTLGTYIPLSGSKNIDIPREVYTFTIGNQSCFYNDVIMAYLNSKVVVAIEIESWYEEGQQKQNVYENFAQKQFWGNNNFYNGGYVNFVRVDVEKNQIITWKCEPETQGSITGYAKWTKTVTDLGSGGLFIAEYGNPGTTYEEIDAAFNAGKVVIAHKKDNGSTIDKYYQLCEIRKNPDLPVNVDCYVFVNSYSYTVEELFRFQSNWSNLETHLATWDYVNQQISAGDFATHADLSSYATQTWVNEQGFLTAHQDLSDYAKTEDLTAYQEKGNYYSASNPSGFINSDAISAMATTGFVAGVSADITAMIPDTSDMATKTWVTGQGYLTAHQSLDGLMSANLLEISDNKITGYNGTAFAGQGGMSADFELSAGSGISIVDYPLEQKTVISVTAQGGNPEVEQAVIDNSATWNTVTAKQDELTFGYHDTAISSIDETALYDASAHARINTLAGRISDLSSNKLDSSAFSDVSGTFLTAHQDLSDYQTIAGMTAYQPAGAYLTTGDSANFYTTANESGFISEVPAGTMNESAFGYDANNKISGYNGSAFAGGTELNFGYIEI